jgi:hypothetical protein
MQERAKTKSHARGHASGTNETESEGDSTSETTGRTQGSSSRWGASLGSNTGWQADTDRANTRFSGGTNDGRSYDDGWSDSESSQEGWSVSTGFARGTNESDSETETAIEHILNASVADQHFLRMQDMRSLPEHVAMVSSEGKNALVRMARFEGFPKTLDGVNIYDEYRRAAHKFLSRRASERSPYEPTIRIVKTPVAASGDEPVRPGKPTPDAPPPPKKPGPRAKG